MRRTGILSKGLSLGLLVATGCDGPTAATNEQAPPPAPSLGSADRSPSVEPGPATSLGWMASLETTELPVRLCGHAAEQHVRALARELASCEEGNPALVVAHVEAGTLVVAASVTRETRESQVVLWLDGARIEALPVSPPSTPPDRDALAVAALVLAHGGPVFVDIVSLRGLAPRSTLGYFESLRLGPIEDERGELYAAVANENVSGVETTMRLEARVDHAGHVAITRTPLARHDEQGTIVALEDAPAIVRTPLPTPVCGSPDEAAVRLRVPEMPSCDEATGLLYVAASTAEGQLVAVRWDGIHGGAITTLGARRSSATARPATPDDRAAVALSILIRMDGLSRVALDLESARALLEPAELPLLRHLGGDPLGVVRRGDRTLLTAISVRHDVLDDGRRSRWIHRCDVDLGDDGAWTATTRYFSHLVDGHVEEGLQPTSQPYPEPIYGAIEL
ncbi:MAG: hypothetical protein J0L92_19195 [Deltaproteobacteria bacterium]|nr:hypothetical protein [Deltaproteobacteria bacterium]